MGVDARTRIGVAALMVALWLGAQGAWPLAVLVLVLTAAWLRRPAGTSGAYGTARWADDADLRDAGMLGDTGLILGRFGKRLLRLPSVTHGMVVASSGAGKSVSWLVPNLLLGWDGPCVIFDPKFELLGLTGEARRRRGHALAVLDAFAASGQAGQGLNPLARLDPDSPQLLEEAKALANATIVRAAEGDRDPHWNNVSEMVLTLFIAWVVYKGRPSERSLQTVAELVADAKAYQGTLVLIQQSDACGGMLRRMAHQVGRLEGKELNSVMSTLATHLEFLNSPQVAAHTACTAEESFDAHRLVAGEKLTLYIGAPADKLRAYARLLRLQLTTVLRAFTRAGPDRHRSPCLFLIDETSQLGPMDLLSDAVTLLRGYGVKMIFFFQSTGQIAEVFPGEKGKTFRSNVDLAQFWAARDIDTAEEISRRLGETTVAVESVNEGDGYSTSEVNGFSPGGQPQWSWNSGSTVSETGRRLLKAEEVLTLPDDASILFVRNLPPICAKLVKYYRDKEFAGGHLGWKTLVGVAVLALVAWAVWNAWETQDTRPRLPEWPTPALQPAPGFPPNEPLPVAPPQKNEPGA